LQIILKNIEIFFLKFVGY